MATETIRRTVVLHSAVDACVRKAWQVLIDAGFEATYSMAVNFMLVGHAIEASQPQGLSDEARASMWDFAADRETVRHVNIQDHLAMLGQLLRDAEPCPLTLRSPEPGVDTCEDEDGTDLGGR
jgi:hypothetical protein